MGLELVAADLFSYQPASLSQLVCLIARAAYQMTAVEAPTSWAGNLSSVRFDKIIAF